MQHRSSARIGIALLIVIVAVIMLGGAVFLAQSLFAGGANKTQSGETSLLSEPTDNTTVKMIVRGPIVAKENHYSIQLDINNSKRRLVIYRGYDQAEEVQKIELDNDAGAFTDLLLALRDNRYTDSIVTSIEKNDGLCASGQIIDFQLADGDQIKSDLWTTSCASVRGNFGGNSTSIIQLLLDQIPGSREAISQAKSL